MCKLIKIPGTMLLCLGLALAGSAQKDTAVMKNNKIDSANYLRKHTALKLKKNLGYYMDRKINIDRVAQLKDAGVNLFEIDKKIGSSFTYREETLLADVIIEGKVIEKRLNSDKAVHFHSEYDVMVTKVLKGNVVSNRIVTIKATSGFVDGAYLDVVHESRLLVGENVLLYLNPIAFHIYEKARREGEQFGTINATASDYTIRRKYIVKNGYVFDESQRKIEKEDATVKNIELIVSINK